MFSQNHLISLLTLPYFYDLDTELDLYQITRGFYGAFATVEPYQQGTLVLPDNWFRPFFDLHMLQLLIQIFPKAVVIFSTFFISNIPWFFLDFNHNIFFL